MYTNEFEGNVTLALRAFEGSNYQVRCAIGKYLAIVLVKFQSLRSESNEKFFFSIPLSNSVCRFDE